MLETKDTATITAALTYVSICKNWKGSRGSCVTYNLKFSQYLNSTKKSFSGGLSNDLEYTQIWIHTTKSLIISNMDFVNFKTFECQLLLQLIQDRNPFGSNTENTTIIVVPSISSLIGDGPFFDRMLEELKKAVIYHG